MHPRHVVFEICVDLLEKLPAIHATQKELEFNPNADEKVPAAQPRHCVCAIIPVPVEKVADGHNRQPALEIKAIAAEYLPVVHF